MRISHLAAVGTAAAAIALVVAALPASADGPQAAMRPAQGRQGQGSKSSSTPALKGKRTAFTHNVPNLAAHGWDIGSAREPASGRSRSPSTPATTAPSSPWRRASANPTSATWASPTAASRSTDSERLLLLTVTDASRNSGCVVMGCQAVWRGV